VRDKFFTLFNENGRKKNKRQNEIQIQIIYWIKHMYIIITMLRNPIHLQTYINRDNT
jgi:hypothetical protein